MAVAFVHPCGLGYCVLHQGGLWVTTDLLRWETRLQWDEHGREGVLTYC